MKHYIIVKFKDGTDVQALYKPVKEIFAVMDMDPEALPAYDVCEPHLRWKEQYGPMMEKKALFDCED